MGNTYPIATNRLETLELTARLSAEHGQRILLVPGLLHEIIKGPIHMPRFTAFAMPDNFVRKDEAGQVAKKGLMAFPAETIDAAFTLSLAINKPETGGVGAGSHPTRRPDGSIELDLMSPNPDDLRGREGAVHLVHSTGWISAGDTFDCNEHPDWTPSQYERPAGRVYSLGSAIVHFEDIALPIRQVADPATAHYSGLAA